jgi:hypothetical protein
MHAPGLHIKSLLSLPHLPEGPGKKESGSKSTGIWNCRGKSLKKKNVLNCNNFPDVIALMR